MKNPFKNNLLILTGILLYNLLFWKEKMGINALLFSGFMVGSLLYLNPKSMKSKAAMLTGIGTLTTAILIVLVNSDLAKVVHTLSLITFAGFVQQRELRYVFYAFSLIVINIIYTPINLINQNLLYWGRKKKWTYGLSSYILPGISISVFYVIYYLANPKFAGLSDTFWSSISGWVQWDISPDKFLFILTSIFLTGGLLSKTTIKWFKQKQAQKQYRLTRIRKTEQQKTSRHSILGLKKEYKSGLLLFLALNTLLLIVNLTDIIFIWFSPAPKSAWALMQYVHEGTYLLIFAILLAMGVILILFRKNINFFPDNIQIRRLAYLWLIQNAVLAISVGMRNYRYIESYGLAYKRIGVFLFLILTIFGLITLYEKVSEKRTLHYVFHKNAWALYLVLLLASGVNWDVLISRYNITANNPNKIDTYFLMHDVSDKNLFLLIEHQEELKRSGNHHNFDKALSAKKSRFWEKQKRYSWLSWNYPDWKNGGRTN